MMLCNRLEKSEDCRNEESSSSSELKSQSADFEPQINQTLSREIQSEFNNSSCPQTMAHHSVQHTEQSYTDITDGRDMTVDICHTGNSDELSHSDVELGKCESKLGDLLLETDCSDQHQLNTANASDTAADINLSMPQKNFTADSTTGSDLSLHNDSNLSLDSGTCDILFVESESEPVIGFSNSEAAHTIGVGTESESAVGFSDSKAHTIGVETDSCDILFVESENEPAIGFSNSEGARTIGVETESESAVGFSDSKAAHVKDHIQSAVTGHITCSVLSTSESDSTATGSFTAKLSWKSGTRCILTASLREVSEPVAERVSNIGSTHVHVTDELSVINGVVQPVESPVKIGESFIL